MKRGDIYMVALHPTQGRDQQGHEQHRHWAVLIVSPAEFNAATKLPVVLPITSGVLDLLARNGRKVDRLPAAIMHEVLAKLALIFE